MPCGTRLSSPFNIPFLCFPSEAPFPVEASRAARPDSLFSSASLALNSREVASLFSLPGRSMCGSQVPQERGAAVEMMLSSSPPKHGPRHHSPCQLTQFLNPVTM